MRPSNSNHVSSMNSRPKIGLFIGDPTGIGPEVAAKALCDEAILRGSKFLIIGDERAFKQGQRIAGLSLSYEVYRDPYQASLSREDLALLDLGNMNPEGYRLGQISTEMGKAVGESTVVSLNLAREGKIDAFVYAPINKEALNRGGYLFESELNFIAKVLGIEEGYGELTCLDDLWTSRVTSHIGIREVADRITKDSVLKAIVLAFTTLKKAKIVAPRIGVSALNPHGGEGGLFGREEAESIGPAISEARGIGIDVAGPYPSDTIFLRRGSERLNAIVSMYHDQGQIATKLLGFNRSVTVSGGLPFPITTPSHGTAYDIAGKGIASPGTMKEAIKLASRMSTW